MSEQEETFTSKLLYTQKCVTQEGASITSTIYSCTYAYPQSTSSLTARLRITCIYFENENGTIDPSAGTMEKWSDKGWQLFEEYCDDQESFNNEEGYRERLLCMSRSFITGAPMETFSKQALKTDEQPDNSKKNVELKIIDFAAKRGKKNDIEEN